jgi:hypothetical protein
MVGTIRTTTLATTLIMLVAMAPVHATTQTITFSKTVSFDNVTVSISATLTIDTTAKTLTGMITILVTNSSTGQIIFSRTTPISVTFPSSNQATFVLGFLTMATSCFVNSSTGASNCIASKNPDLLFQGKVNLLDVSAFGAAWNSSPGTANWNPAADLNGDGKVDLLDASIIGADWQAPVFY